jgi:hypothetical protein
MHRFATLRSSALSSAKRRTASLVYLPQLNATFPRASSRRKAALSHAAQLPAARIVAAQRPAHQRNATSRKKSFAAQRPAVPGRSVPRKASLLEAPRSNSTQRLDRKGLSTLRHAARCLASRRAATPVAACLRIATSRNNQNLSQAARSPAWLRDSTQRNVSKKSFRNRSAARSVATPCLAMPRVACRCKSTPLNSTQRLEEKFSLSATPRTASPRFASQSDAQQRTSQLCGSGHRCATLSNTTQRLK